MIDPDEAAEQAAQAEMFNDEIPARYLPNVRTDLAMVVTTVLRSEGWRMPPAVARSTGLAVADALLERPGLLRAALPREFPSAAE